MHTIAILSQKGGTGKTTTAHAIGTGLAKEGARVLMVDADPQGSLTAATGARYSKTLADVLCGVPATDAITDTGRGRLIAGAQSLSWYGRAGEDRNALKGALRGVTGAFDYCLIDCQPIIGALVMAALNAADSVIITAIPDAFSALQSLPQTFGAISAPGVPVTGVLLTKYHARTILDRDTANAIEQCAAEYGTKLFRARIRECVAIREAQLLRRSIWDYAPNCTAAQDYAALIRELKNDIEKGVG